MIFCIGDAVSIRISFVRASRSRLCADRKGKNFQTFCGAFFCGGLQHVVHEPAHVFREDFFSPDIVLVKCPAVSVFYACNCLSGGVFSSVCKGCISVRELQKGESVAHSAEGKGERFVGIFDCKSHSFKILGSSGNPEFVEQFYGRNVDAAGKSISDTHIFP